MRADNNLLAFVQAHREACEVEFSLMRLACWLLASGIAVIAVMLVLHLAPAVAMVQP